MFTAILSNNNLIKINIRETFVYIRNFVFHYSLEDIKNNILKSLIIQFLNKIKGYP